MKNLLVLGAVVLAAAGCTSDHHDADDHAAPDATEMHATDATETASADAVPASNDSTFDSEIGCGKCIYHIENVTGCSVAAKVDGTAVLVKGGDIDPHTLCSGPQKARLTGVLRGPTFVATRVELLDPSASSTASTGHLEVELGCGHCVFQMDGVDGCTVAARSGEGVFLVEGGGVDAHSLCAGPREAVIDGQIEDGRIIASAITMK